ncbi:MAG TPA: hypothetical protein PKK00_00305 [Bacteroidales bacterium]|nr:hypothetical protein [Bacteroidales bacterium]HPS16241.1 hypothetical protein [Bacteroidales bacterium]
MKKIFFTILLMVNFSSLVFSQQQQPNPVILQMPTGWGFERINLPFDFAPEINYSGFEEIRFAPGMFDTTSVNYFTYAFVVCIDGKKNFQKDDIKNFLDKYYKGLCLSVGQPKKLTPDTALIKSEIKVVPSATELPIYSATVPFFDTFSNGRKINLFMEIESIIKTETNKTYLTILVSANKSNTEVWNKLHEVRNNMIIK